MAAIVVAGGVAAGWAVFWALGLPAVSGRSALSVAGRLPVRVLAGAIGAIIIGGLLAWAFRPVQTLRRPPATNIEETRRQAVRQNDREVRETIVRVLAQRLQRSADTSWSANDFDLNGVLFEDAWFGGARFSGKHAWFDGAVFTGPNTSFEDVEFNAEVVSFEGANFESDAAFAGATFRARSASFDEATFGGKASSFDEARFAGEYVSFRRVGFSSGTTSFGSAAFKCLRASFDSPAEWKNVEFDWDNPPSGTQPTIPRCITPRPCRRTFAAKEQDDDLDG